MLHGGFLATPVASGERIGRAAEGQLLHTIAAWHARPGRFNRLEGRTAAYHTAAQIIGGHKLDSAGWRRPSETPRGALLLTFDDGYAELLDVVLPILKELAIPAVVFAVSERLGGTNDWDVALGAPQLRLMDADALHRLAESGIEIGAHSRTHPFFTRVSKNQLHAEIAGSVADLEAIGLARPRLFAYPHGEWNQTVKQAAREAGLQAGFTIDPNLSRSNQDPYQIPRIEILRQDVGWKFLYKVIVAGLWTRLPLTRALIDLSSTLRTQLRHRLRQRALRQRNVSQR